MEDGRHERRVGLGKGGKLLCFRYVTGEGWVSGRRNDRCTGMDDGRREGGKGDGRNG